MNPCVADVRANVDVVVCRTVGHGPLEPPSIAKGLALAKLERLPGSAVRVYTKAEAEVDTSRMTVEQSGNALISTMKNLTVRADN